MGMKSTYGWLYIRIDAWMGEYMQCRVVWYRVYGPGVRVAALVRYLVCGRSVKTPSHSMCAPLGLEPIGPIFGYLTSTGWGTYVGGVCNCSVLPYI